MKILFLPVIVLLSFCSKAQNFINYSPASNVSGTSTMNASVSGDGKVLGSTYLFKEWNNVAKIYTNANTVINVENVNFNAQDATFSSKISKDSVFVFADIYKVEVNGKLFERVNGHFYEVLYIFKDDQMFLKNHIATLKPELHKITSTVIGPGKYVMEDEFYIYKNTELSKFWPSKKNVLNLLNSEKSLISKQAKSRQLSFSKEMDLVELFRYYDTL